MKSMSTFLALGISIFLTFSACSSSNKPEQKSNLTAGNVKQTLKKGKTNQAEVLNSLGSPNLVTRNSDGEEVWNYSRQSYDSESGSYGGGIILFGGNKAFSSSASSTFDLIITFDKNDVVKDYKVVQSQY